ncbi:hypothetical protein EKPV-NSW-ORF014 [Eastern grey kangaroopox virus]|uniref:Uncharacterized protein n=1 Tax=Eastern grey kangaroopox virus TaxID=2042482 RepID=A0A345Z0N5_9POXV|nr:hypothetical protein EKPV-NSW-ORF014 [Eastern grey kangaroopox virus]
MRLPLPAPVSTSVVPVPLRPIAAWLSPSIFLPVTIGSPQLFREVKNYLCFV